MNKKGFTLIELLAVIVILAIIAVIAVPIVINIIEETKENATLSSADFYLDAVEISISNAYLYHGGLTDGEYPITPDGNLCKTALPCSEENTLKVEVNGETPTSGKIAINSGNISSIELNYKDGKTIVKNSLNELVDKKSMLCTANTTKAKALVRPEDGGDPDDVSSYTEEEVGFLASDVESAFKPGVAYTCNFIDDNETNNMTFFVLSSTEDTVTLISGVNLGGRVAWSEDGNNYQGETAEKQAVTAKAALSERISTWEKIKDMDDVIVKLPTAYDIAEVVGQTLSGEFIESLPKWLYGHAKSPNSNTLPPISYGYWTTTPITIYDSDFAWYVDCLGRVNYGPETVDDGYSYSVRPVITISKSDI